MVTLFFILMLISSIGLVWTSSKVTTLSKKTGELEQSLVQTNAEKSQIEAERAELEAKLLLEVERNRVVISQKKSSETRLGQIAEHMVPVLEAFPYDPKNCHFLGMPIDYIVFDFDEGKIVFLEVKTGNARESDRQKVIKNIIKSGRVFYERIRLNEKGVNVKKEVNLE